MLFRSRGRLRTKEVPATISWTVLNVARSGERLSGKLGSSRSVLPSMHESERIGSCSVPGNAVNNRAQLSSRDLRRPVSKSEAMLMYKDSSSRADRLLVCGYCEHKIEIDSTTLKVYECCMNYRSGSPSQINVDRTSNEVLLYVM